MAFFKPLAAWSVTWGIQGMVVTNRSLCTLSVTWYKSSSAFNNSIYQLLIRSFAATCPLIWANWSCIVFLIGFIIITLGTNIMLQIFKVLYKHLLINPQKAPWEVRTVSKYFTHFIKGESERHKMICPRSGSEMREGSSNRM